MRAAPRRACMQIKAPLTSGDATLCLARPTSLDWFHFHSHFGHEHTLYRIPFKNLYLLSIIFLFLLTHSCTVLFLLYVTLSLHFVFFCIYRRIIVYRVNIFSTKSRYSISKYLYLFFFFCLFFCFFVFFFYLNNLVLKNNQFFLIVNCFFTNYKVVRQKSSFSFLLTKLTIIHKTHAAPRLLKRQTLLIIQEWLGKIFSSSPES